VRIIAEITDLAATLTLTRAEALMFFEFLSRFDSEEQLDIRDPAKNLVLWHLQGAFERTLFEAFAVDYKARLGAAREAVRCSV
jgi:hypothetical protein